MDDGAHRALVRHTAFDTFRHQLLGTGRGVLEVTIRGALRLRHGTERTHATVGFVGTALEQFDFAWSFFGTGQHRADHHGRRARHDGFGQVTGEADTAIGDQRHTGAGQCSGDVGYGRDLRHTDTRYDTGGADRAWADTDFHAVSAGVCQGLGRFASGDVAADNLHLREGLLDPTHAVDHAFGVAVGGVDHHHVNPGGDQRSNTIARVGASADSGANAQTTLVVLAGQRVGLGFFDVVNGHHAFQVEGAVDDQHALDAVLVQQFAHGVFVRAFADCHQSFFRRHHVTHLGIQAVFETHVAGSHDTDQIALTQHRHAGDIVLPGQLKQVTHTGVSVDADRVFDHAGFELLDLAHFGGLLLDGHVLVDDADATFLRHGNRQTGFGDGIHGRGHQRNIQLDATREAGLEADILG